MTDLEFLLKTAFNSGVNAGITQAAHEVGLLRHTKEKTFEDFCKEPGVVLFMSRLENALKSEPCKIQ